jgi:hypothetical protein
MTRRWRWVLGVVTVALVVVVTPVLWMRWRNHSLIAFCREVHAGMSLSDLFALEDRHWIGKSFIVQAVIKDYIDQVHAHELEFRSVMFDPPFACIINHDGKSVTNVQLLKLAGVELD